MIKSVFFDLGNTLANISIIDRLTKLDVRLLKSVGCEITEEKVREITKRTDEFIERKYRGSPERHKLGLFFKTMCQMLGKEIDDKTAEEKDMVVKEYILQRTKLMPHAVEILKFLKNKGMKLAIICNGTKDGANKQIDNLGLRKYFDLIIVSEEIGYEKSTTVPFKVALDKLNLKPEEVIMVGDRIDEDVLGAKRIGMKAVKFNFGSRKDINYDKDKREPDFEIDNLSQLKGILEKMI